MGLCLYANYRSFVEIPLKNNQKKKEGKKDRIVYDEPLKKVYIGAFFSRRHQNVVEIPLLTLQRLSILQ